MHLEDGRYPIIEFKLGSSFINEGAQNLNKIEQLIETYNTKYLNMKMRTPDLKIVITAETYGYKRDDGVFVIPIGRLKD